MKNWIKKVSKKDIVYLCIIVGLGVVAVWGFADKGSGPYSVIQSSELDSVYEADEEEYDWVVEEFASNLEIVSDLQFDYSGNLYFTERPGRLKKIPAGDNKPISIATLENVASVGESGLTGLALHPNFEENNFIYLYYTYRESGLILNRVSRFTLQSDKLSNETPVVDTLPGGSIHNGGRMRFGPDNQLWVLTGDAGRPSLADDMDSLAGKVLRMDDLGNPVDDNPYPNSTVYSIGHRNPQGLSWHPLTEELVVNSHGESGYDEVYIVKPKDNHGWPVVDKCFSDNPELTNPIFCSGNETWAPSGATFIGDSPWRFRNSYVFTGLRGNILKRIAIVDGSVIEDENIIDGGYGRLRSVVSGPDGSLYVGTSNLDGRGEPTESDDRILKVTPVLRTN